MATSTVASSVRMRPIRIVYDDLRFGEIEETDDSVDHIVSRLESIGREFSPRVRMPFGIDLVATNGDRLSVAIGLGGAVVSHYNDKTVETVIAVGNPAAVGNTLFYFGDHTLIPNKFLLPVDLALHVVREWCERNTLSSLAQWSPRIR